jgi:3',5'-cyclic AMP phosphodiesterase CpdA
VTQTLWIMSDLHLELTRGWDLPPPGARPAFDVMVVAGDLVTGMERGVRWLRERVTDRPVLYVAGNHEPYGRDIARDLEKARVAAAGTNVHVLENESLTVDGTTFLASTLWTDFALRVDPEAGMRLAGEKMNDYRKIRTNRYRLKLRPLDTLRKHQESRAFIARELAAHQGERCVVVSHHSPLPDPDADALSVAFASDLTSLILDGAPCLWVFGHTHESVDTTVGSTRVVSNAKGYGPWSSGETFENPGFDPNFTVEI